MRFLAWSAILGLLCVGGCEKHMAATVSAPVPTAITAPDRSSPPTGANEPGLVPEPKSGPKTTPAAPSPEHPGEGIVPGQLGKMPKGPLQAPDKIPAPEQEGWHATPMTPTALAKNMDAAFYHLHGGIADIKVHYLMPSGEGFSEGSGKFPKDDTFSVKYPIIEGDPPHPQVVEMRGKDGRYVYFHPGQGEHKEAYSAVRRFEPGGSLNAGDVLNRWPTEMPQLAMSHFVIGKDVYAPLVSALTAPESGFTVTTEERTVNSHGVAIKDYRIIATRKATAANHSKAVQLEVVVDARKFVPVTMRANTKTGKAKASVIEWAGAWKGGKFDPKDFVLPSK